MKTIAEQLTFSNKIYENVVSFGCMCSLALYLRKLGLRSASCFFDWITSDIKNNMMLVNNNFSNFFDKELFKQQYPGYAHLITNTKYNFVYSHVFNPKETLEKQYSSVKRRVQKSINNFNKSIKNNCLLVYYSRDFNEINWIFNNQKIIDEFVKKNGCDILFIFNFDINGKFIFPKFIIPQNNIHKPNGGGVSFPFENTEEIDAYLLSHYDPKRRMKNLKHRSHVSIYSRIKRRLQSKSCDKLIIE